jgi:hypothetical protein
VHWANHSAFRGQHAQTLSPSKYHWLGYDDDKFDRIYAMQEAAARGTRIHAIAAELIDLRIPLRSNGTTLSMYVNDGIGYRMRTEQPLVYSPNAFGAVDAISFRKAMLRIHDLKTGLALTSFKQLEVYAALFCLEYLENPFKIKMELRIYQNDDIRIHIPDPDDIKHHMEKIKYFDKRLDLLRKEDEES